MWKINVLFLTCAIFALCESAAIVDKINEKCSVNDNECLQRLYGGFLQEIADNGIPEFDIPKIDPYVIKDMDLSAFGMLKITMVDGTAKGFKNCHSTSYINDIEARHTKIVLECDLFTIEGQYKIESTPALLSLAGGINVHGDGKGGIVIEKIKLNLDFAFEIKKHDDGELYYEIDPEESDYSYEILGKATFSADNIFVGSQEISTVAINIINENWEFVTKTMGKPVLDKGLGVFYEQVAKFFNKVPVKDLTIEDLSSYVKS